MAALTDRESAKLISRGTPVTDPALAENLVIAEAKLISALQARKLESEVDFGDTAMLRRFLMARKLQVEPAVEMLIKHLEWRKANLPVRMTPAIEAELKKGKTFVRGCDLQGRPLMVIKSACFDPKTRDLEATVLAFVHQLEEALSNMPEGQSQLCIFYDRTGFKLRNLDTEMLSRCVKVFSDNYPERLGAMYVFPAGLLASTVFKMVSPLMEARTASKVEMVKSASRLGSILPPEHIPVQYGGTAVDGTVPDITAPDVTAPDVTAPNLTAPHVEAPDVTAPSYTAPDLTAPDVTAPNITAPDVKAPDMTAPNLTAPDVTAPDFTAPNLTAPGVKAPDVMAPDIRMGIKA